MKGNFFFAYFSFFFLDRLGKRVSDMRLATATARAH